jgi:hypothetical protein
LSGNILQFRWLPCSDPQQIRHQDTISTEPPDGLLECGTNVFRFGGDKPNRTPQ